MFIYSSRSTKTTLEVYSTTRSLKTLRFIPVPYETKKEGGNTVIRFYPKGENAKNPDGIVFMLSLGGSDRKKMSEIIS